jgi:mono/diheme cytochrome c family protein
MRLCALVGVLLASVSCQHTRRSPADGPAPSERSGTAELAELPIAGTQIPLLPSGDARRFAQDHCLACHASEMIQQQRLTETQWKAELDKMQRWGAEIRDEDKEALARYLVAHFGPDNDRFVPIVARP